MRKKVLLIDGSITIHKIVELTINRHKYELISAYTLEDGIHLAGQSADFILLDNKLIKTDPAGLIEKFRTILPESFYLLMVSPNETAPENVTVDTVLNKPFNAKTLNDTLDFLEHTEAVQPGTPQDQPISEGDTLSGHEKSAFNEDIFEFDIPTCFSDMDPEGKLSYQPSSEISESDNSLRSGNKIPQGVIPENTVFKEFEGTEGYLAQSPLELESRPTDSKALPVAEQPVAALSEPIPMPPREKDVPLYEPTEPIPLGENAPQDLHDVPFLSDELNSEEEIQDNESLADFLNEELYNDAKTLMEDLYQEENEQKLYDIYSLMTTGGEAPIEVATGESADPLRQEMEERQDIMELFEEMQLQTSASEPVPEAGSQNIQQMDKPFSIDHFQKIAYLAGTKQPASTLASPSIPETAVAPAGKLTIEFSKDELLKMVEKSLGADIIEEIVRDAVQQSLANTVEKILPSLAEKIIKEEISRLVEKSAEK